MPVPNDIPSMLDALQALALSPGDLPAPSALALAEAAGHASPVAACVAAFDGLAPIADDLEGDSAALALLAGCARLIVAGAWFGRQEAALTVLLAITPRLPAEEPQQVSGPEGGAP